MIIKTPLQFSQILSKRYKCNVYLKREDLQIVRSFKVRGALNKINTLSSHDKKLGVVCASAGNHAQGVALSCQHLNLNGHIFVPEQTPSQKIDRIKYFSNGKCKLYTIGSTFDECLKYANDFQKQSNLTFIHPYDDLDVIIGQSNVCKEICNEIQPDFIIGTIGGGGLMSGICKYVSTFSKTIPKLIGVETETCDAMSKSISENRIIDFKINDTFVDGATVSKVGELTFNICSKYLDDIIVVDTGKACTDIIMMYQDCGIIVEPAGVLPITSLEYLPEKDIQGKNVVCIISGGNNDISRYPEIIERSLRYENKKHYFLIKFIQKPGELKKFIINVLGETDDICRFEYIKRNNTEFGDVLVGIHLSDPNSIINVLRNLEKFKFKFKKLNSDSLYDF